MNIKKICNNSESLAFLTIFALSLLVRIYASFTSLAQIFPDEIFQTLEPAHKLVFGRGFTYWEFKVGARSWFLPGIIAGVYKLLDLCGVKDPLYINIGVKIFYSIFNSLAVSVVYLLFRRHGLDKKEAFLFSLPLAASYLLSYISVRTISESAALPFMVFAVYFASNYVEKETKKDLFFTIITVGIAYMIRFQTCIFAFGLFIALFLTAKKRFRAALIFGAGYIGMMLIQGIMDIFTWGKFAQSLITYLDYNIIRKVSDNFSVSPWYFFIKEFAATFHPLTYIPAILMMIFAIINFRKNKSLVLFFFPFLFFFAIHSAIAHKQPRFVFACCFALLALSAESFAFLCKKYAKNRKNAAVFLSLFLLFSLDAFPHLKYSTLWNHSTTVVDNFYGRDKGKEKIFGGVLETEAELGRIPDLKRAYLFGIPQIWSGGHSYFHKNAPISFASKPDEIKKMLHKAVTSKQSGAYCAFKKDIGIPAGYRKNLEEISTNDDFAIYKIEITE